MAAILFLLLFLHAFGAPILMFFALSCYEIYGELNCDFFTPSWWYARCEIDWFGAFLCSLFFNLLCPAWAVGYWIKKLCTDGRKEK